MAGQLPIAATRLHASHKNKADASQAWFTFSFCSNIKKSIAAAGVGMLLLLLLGLPELVAMALPRCAALEVVIERNDLLTRELSITGFVA
jgi:hypothetical protein